MSRSALGRGLGSLLAENGTRGVPMPGPGVGRLMQPGAAPAPPQTSATSSVLATDTVAKSAVRTWSVGFRRVLWVADLALVGVGFWLGAFSPLAGQGIALVAAGVLLAVGALLGVLAAS